MRPAELISQSSLESGVERPALFLGEVVVEGLLLVRGELRARDRLGVPLLAAAIVLLALGAAMRRGALS